MLHLLKLEWLKVKNYRTFWVIFILFLISIIGVNYMTYEMQQEIFGSRAKKDPANQALKFFIGNPPYAYPQVWQMVSQATSYLLIIPGLLTIILFTNEFSYRTHRQNLIDGLTRAQFITSKILSIVVLSVITTIMVVITSLIFGYIGGKPFSIDKAYYVGYSFIQSLNYCLFALLCGVVFKRSGITIGVYFLYVVILENVIFFAFKAFKYTAGYFFPVESADGLISAPIFQSMQERLFPRPPFEYIMATCIAYILAYIFLSYRKFKTDDL